MTRLLRRNTTPAMILPIILSLLYLAPSALMPWIWIDLRAVTVSDAPSALSASINVDRSTHIGFYGSYDVTFRNASDDMVVCVVQGPTFNYKGGLSNPVHKTLAWWVNGDINLIHCMRAGLHDWRFYAVTCQNVLALGLSIARRCTRSNDFFLGE